MRPCRKHLFHAAGKDGRISRLRGGGRVGGECRRVLLAERLCPCGKFPETAKITSFIARDHVGKGIGKQCLDQLEADARQMGIENIIAEISSENRGSLKFHASNGFAFCGELKNIGYKLNRSFGVVYMQKTL